MKDQRYLINVFNVLPITITLSQEKYLCHEINKRKPNCIQLLYTDQPTNEVFNSWRPFRNRTILMLLFHSLERNIFYILWPVFSIGYSFPGFPSEDNIFPLIVDCELKEFLILCSCHNRFAITINHCCAVWESFSTLPILFELIQIMNWACI